MTESFSLHYVFRQIVLTAVPLALTHEETDLLVDDLLDLARELSDEEPASVFFELRRRIGAADHSWDAWRSYTDTLLTAARRRETLARIRAAYPALTDSR